jgi:hypothetical protein
VTNSVTVEIETAPGTWLDITTDVYQRDSIQIVRGRGDEQSQTQPGRMMFTLDNRDGRYSPRNPLSDLYGKIGRNTPVRCTMGIFPRFYGEISSWPPRWDEAHADNYIPIEAYGILRRLGQGQPTVSTALRDFILGQTGSFLTSLAAYYPLSGGDETTYSQNLAPDKTGSFRGVKDPGPGPIFLYGKEMQSWIGTGMELNATGTTSYMSGNGGQAGAVTALDFVWRSTAFGVLTVQLTDYSRRSWWVAMNTSSDAATLQVSTQDDDGNNTTFTATGVIEEMQDRDLHHFRLMVATNGSNTDYTVYVDGVSVNSGTLTGGTVNGVRECRFFYSRYTNQTVTDIAHVAVWAGASTAVIPSAVDCAGAALGYAGETAIDRVARVATDGGIPYGTVGTASESMPMGPQFSESRLEQIRDCEATDMGILYEHRVTGALMYRSRSSLYNTSVSFTLDYAAGQVSPPLEPIDDDQTTRNDVTATRREGGSDRFTVDTGRLSTQDPPDGVGRYDAEVTANPETDGYLYGIAGWVANIGTLDRARWPSVTVNLNSPNIPPSLADSLRAAEIGDWFTITNMDEAFVYDDVTLIIVGYSETIDPFVHAITFVCMPAEPYTVAVYDTARYDADGSTVTSNVTSTATSLSATKSGTSLWTTDATMFPFDIRVGGERMTVTNITGSTSPQTMTVTRSKNGVVKAQTAGTAIELWDTPRYAL